MLADLSAFRCALLIWPEGRMARVKPGCPPGHLLGPRAAGSPAQSLLPASPLGRHRASTPEVRPFRVRPPSSGSRGPASRPAPCTDPAPRCPAVGAVGLSRGVFRLEPLRGTGRTWPPCTLLGTPCSVPFPPGPSLALAGLGRAWVSPPSPVRCRLGQLLGLDCAWWWWWWWWFETGPVRAADSRTVQALQQTLYTMVSQHAPRRATVPATGERRGVCA